MNDVDREARSDWLDERDGAQADEIDTPTSADERDDEQER